MSAARITGRVKWFNSKAGYGFITASEGDFVGKDIFVHFSSIKSDASHYKYLTQGEYVDFSLTKPSNEKHEFHAVEVSGVKGGPILCETRRSNVVASRSSVEDTPNNVVETPEPKGEHKDFMKDRYMLLDGNDKYVLQEIKLNDPNKKRSAKLFFGSELLRVGENNNDNMSNKKLNNDDAFNINDGNFEEFKNNNKPIKLSKPKKIIDKPIEIINEPRTSSRVRTKNKNIFNDDFIN